MDKAKGGLVEYRITGYAPKGCITAVMGPSGAGKSTLLDGLAGRTLVYRCVRDRFLTFAWFYDDSKSSRNTYIGDEGTRGVSGGERRRVSIGVDIIHGPSLLFLDEPTSGLDSTSAHSVIEKVHHIARSGSIVILTIHQPSSRIQLLLDHLIILARGQLMYQGSPKDVTLHLSRMGRKLPKGENSIEYLIDGIQEYDQSELGVEALATRTILLFLAAVIAFTALFFLFCGYFLNSHDIPIYWRWMNKISTMTYSYEGLLMNQYQTSDPFGINPAGQIVNGTTILKSLGISTDESKKWENVLVMLDWAVLYRIFFYIVLRFFSKNQRS
ncbi:ABC transporter G family member 17-like [Populus alba x Populus x berolinensis]|nr:ABC transporter G family member 17-like [Populus alba x Populus x berolinensis]